MKSSRNWLASFAFSSCLQFLAYGARRPLTPSPCAPVGSLGRSGKRKPLKRKPMRTLILNPLESQSKDLEIDSCPLSPDARKVERNTGNNPCADRLHSRGNTKDQRGFSDCGGREYWQTWYEKNADQFRAAASTQKLLTALVVAESGFLDRQVTVQPTDTMADPVKLNIKAGDTYQRIDLLRALLVKILMTSRDVWRGIMPVVSRSLRRL